MAFNQKRVEPEYQETVVWQCASCICWSRKEFSPHGKTNCPICGSQMIEEVKKIQIINKETQRRLY